MDAEDYVQFINGTPSADLLARLAAYHTSHPEAGIAARAWLADRVARANDIGPIHVHVGDADAERIAAGLVETLRRYAAAKTPAPIPPTHAKPMPARALVKT